eukprot:CAMPEP_0202859556 /NCGR_PEP_ID=MMETSP1391-20130828/1614_1 /ASSEMBLY_ACC=CAM_ASM_000867 /TAXON_ID=1034604 /ORGANISM="Chlamydomonas leiostraca, Strain SAG 11-49" /LENGTH=200 /DNA_ID=CAMNT_0049538597 /DNA_START=69 /DNA_END=669 /DNA_ORIENTATION=+
MQRTDAACGTKAPGGQHSQPCTMHHAAAMSAIMQASMGSQQLHLQHVSSHVLHAAVSDEEVTSSGMEDLPLPETRYQRSLDMKQIKALRTASNTAAKDKTLAYIQVGQQGVTQTFLSAAMDILQKHEFVRVKLGEGSGLERKDTASQLELLLDAVCVHQIGFTITLYRQHGLPRPSNCPSNRQQDLEGAVQVVGGGAEEA